MSDTTNTLAERLVNAAGLPIWSVLDAESPEKVDEMVRAAVAATLRTLADARVFGQSYLMCCTETDLHDLAGEVEAQS